MEDARKLGPDILVGTPGRLEDILCGRKRKNAVAAGAARSQAALSCKGLEVVILDEADKLLDMGFQQSIAALLRVFPKQRRTGLFSATMTEALTELVRVGLRNPVRVVVKVEGVNAMGVREQRTPLTLKIRYLICPPDRKLAQLVRLIQYREPQKYMVYFSTCAAVDYFYRLLHQLAATDAQGTAPLPIFGQHAKSVTVCSLHGQMNPKRREATYGTFSALPSGSIGILFCTDVASRGLDLPDVDCVIQWDPPTDPKAFSHRCGRTARAGREGSAFVFLNRGREETFVDFMRIRKIPMTKASYLLRDPKTGTISPLTIATDDISDDSALEDWDPAVLEDADSDKLIEYAQHLISKDRDLYEKSIKAFVSFVRSYSKHEASYIFTLKELDLPATAMGFALLKLPKMPELIGNDISAFRAVDIDVEKIEYRDKTREKQRQVRLAKDREERLEKAQESKNPKKRGSKSDAWSQRNEAKERRRERKEKKLRKLQAQKADERARLIPNGDHGQLIDVETALQYKAKGTRSLQSLFEERGPIRVIAKGDGGLTSKRIPMDDEDDWEELAREERLAKKLKKGKISKKEFERETAAFDSDLD
ncbi:ATP-dependent rRNA helicase spb4 [Spiromyces aspiralis]|uniref:ATP-dependent rRNA helicase spb4 n=1 Tax=Spiromyces aspiralis TaxID=68401 RepID=A0ACC1HSX2_9FUNG|nr:ATP-dependent rRNA helicase spb4 [Spiromyces aspiralis]